MAQLVVVPELVENLLLLHVGRELFLLDAGRLALQLDDFTTTFLRGFLRTAATPFQFQLGLADLVDLPADGCRSLVNPGKLLGFLFRLLLHRGDLLLCLLNRLPASITVTRKAVQQDSELLHSIADRRKLRLQRRFPGSKSIAVFHRNVQIVAHHGKG